VYDNLFCQGHLAQDCFHSKGSKAYELVTEDSSKIAKGEDIGNTSQKKKKKKVCVKLWRKFVIT